MQVYVLKCNFDKYYIDITNDDNQLDIDDIAYNAQYHGPAWIQAFYPLEIVEQVRINDESDIDVFTKKYMKYYGIDNVRSRNLNEFFLDPHIFQELEQELSADVDIVYDDTNLLTMWGVIKPLYEFVVKLNVMSLKQADINRYYTNELHKILEQTKIDCYGDGHASKDLTVFHSTLYKYHVEFAKLWFKAHLYKISRRGTIVTLTNGVKKHDVVIQDVPHNVKTVDDIVESNRLPGMFLTKYIIPPEYIHDITSDNFVLYTNFLPTYQNLLSWINSALCKNM